MLPLPFVQDLDVFNAAGLHAGMGFVANAMHPFVLETVEPAIVSASITMSAVQTWFGAVGDIYFTGATSSTPPATHSNHRRRTPARHLGQGVHRL